ncbi:MFS transporter [Candidatus Lokiarchaeum ossiferum]|uniref:MFS transporter n=1 Tax=Candidatus Lokiarchaeum ossiferum TaxID=2951803 RepID=UPI00352F4168
MEENQGKFTQDFRAMINIVFWNGLGMFFLEFIILYFCNQVLHASATDIGMLVSVQILGYSISSPIAGALTDKISKKKLVLLGSFGRATAYLIIYAGIILKTLWIMGCGTFSIGFGAGFFWVSLDTLLSEKSNKKNRTQAYGMRMAAVGRGQLLGSVIGFTIFGFAQGNNLSPFLLFSPILLYSMANFYAGFKFRNKVDDKIKFVNEETSNSEEKISSTLTLKKNWIYGILFLYLVILLSNFNGSLAKPFIQIYLMEFITQNTDLILAAYFCNGILTTILAPKLGKIIDKIRPEWGISLASIAGALFTLLLLQTYNFYLFTFLMIIDFTIASVAGLSIQNILSRISERNRGKIFGFQNLMGNIGSILGPVLGGILWDSFRPQTPFIVSIYIELALIPFFLLAIKSISPYLAEKIEEKKSISNQENQFQTDLAKE